jgi:hypothetical protein
MLDGARPVNLSPDSRQALCYQCHAPDFTLQARSGDDRTCIGVHEGLSCLACHSGHDQDARASCAQCHPRMSNCGLDVERMDTTFRSPASLHNIHFVKCADCHPNGVPPPIHAADKSTQPPKSCLNTVGPFSTKISATPISEPPAMTPEATGKL